VRSKILSRVFDEVLDLPSYVSELNTLLSSVPVDLKRVGKIIREHPKLSDHIMHLCKLRIAGFDDQTGSIDHGVVFLGTQQMRTLILACCMIVDIGSCYSLSQLRSFWQHGFLTASLSERIALYIGYRGPTAAWRAGLFHDAGALALVRWAADTLGAGSSVNAICGEVIEEERKGFGTDHCFVGGLIGRKWGLPQEIVDVLEFHHNPDGSKYDRVLVGIVAAADKFCVGRGIKFQLVKEPTSEPREESFHQEFCYLLPGLDNDLARNLKDVLEITYLQEINRLTSNCGSVFGGVA
jgi:HD-like signal output (HDOD) protein